MKTEALKLADKLDGLNSCEPVIIKACEDMIRKLVAEIEKLELCLESRRKEQERHGIK